MPLVELLHVLHVLRFRLRAEDGRLAVLRDPAQPVSLWPEAAHALHAYHPLLLQLAQHTPDGPWPRPLPRRAEAS